MQFYTYVWYDQDWIPYYVGKGVGTRSRQRRDIPHPEEGHVVLKYFDLEEEAFEHEKQLIAFWGRRDLDTDGLLMNKALGGPGKPGVPATDAQRKASIRNGKVTGVKFGTKNFDAHRSANGKRMGPSNGRKCRKTFVVTSPEGVETTIHGLNAFCLANNLRQGAMSSVAAGDQKQHRGWKCRHA